MSEAAVGSTPKIAGPGVNGPLKDFKGWLSPMLVKELRQGLRTRVFVMAFILMQASIMVVMLGAAANGAAGRATNMIWLVAGLVMLAAMPLRGFSALSNEMRMQTMDLLTLTRLSAFRITFGKWAALFSQTLLLATALMPYIVIRYFLGGVDLATELTMLFVFVLLSGVLTAVTVGFSAHPSILLRGAIVGVVGIMGGALVGNIFDSVFDYGMSPMSSESFWLLMVALVIFAVFCTYYLLDMGATQFAPFAENHSTRKRLAALLFFGAMSVLAFVADDPDIPEGLFAMLVMSLVIVCVDAMTERPAPVPSLYVPFVKRGGLGKLFGKLFYPGWHTGVAFFGLAMLLLLLFAGWFDVGDVIDDEGMAMWIAGMGVLLFPVVLIRLFFRKAAAPFALYLLIQCITVPLVGLLAAIDDGQGMLWLACPIPVAQLFLIEGSYNYRSSTALALPFLFTIGYYVLLLCLSFKEHRAGKVLEQRAEEALRGA